MASHVIGLDIGTNAVRAVELSLGRGLPTVRRMAQVALPVGAVAAGEVVDVHAVSDALKRLWRQGGFRKKSVVVGVANQRVVARIADLPDFPEDELRASLPFHVQDLIPIPVEDAQLDFQVIERIDVDGEARLRVMLVAAHRDMLRSVLAALEGAGLSAEAVDLVPFALVRALHDPATWLSDDAAIGREEVVVGVGAGVTNVVVHGGGVTHFVRTLPVGGLAATEAVASDLAVDVDTAEGLKREARARAGGGSGDESPFDHVVAVAAGSVDPLVGEIAGSLDFYLAQTDAPALHRVLVTGGGARLDAFRDRLEDALGVAVVEADAFTQVQRGRVGLADDVVDANADLFTVAVGLALGGREAGAQPLPVDLLPREVAVRRAVRRQAFVAGGGVAAFAGLLLSLSYLRGAQVDDARAEAVDAEARVSELQQELASLREVEQMEADIAARRGTVVSVLEGDVDWTGLLNDVTTVMPNDVWLTSFTGTRGAAGSPGTVQVAAKGFDQTSAARWLLRLADVAAVEEAWIPSSRKEGGETTRELVTFSSDARLTAEATSDRADQAAQEGR